MRLLQNVFQVVGRPAFLILFLFGFLGAECSRVTGGGALTPPDTNPALAKQQEKVDAAEKAAEEERKKAEEAKKQAEAARQAGDAAKAAEEERKQKEAEEAKKQAEAEADKQRQIKAALEIAASTVNKAHEAVEKVAAAKKQIAETRFASGNPFSKWESEAKKARAEAFKAYDAVHTATEISAAFDRAEEVSLAANKAEQQARQAEEFVSLFQSRFTTDNNAKALIESSSDKTNDSGLKTQCDNHITELFGSITEDLANKPAVSVRCQGKPQTGPHRGASYNCFCEYDKGSNIFYKK